MFEEFSYGNIEIMNLVINNTSPVYRPVAPKLAMIFFLAVIMLPQNFLIGKSNIKINSYPFCISKGGTHGPDKKPGPKNEWIISKDLVFSKKGEARNKLLRTLVARLESNKGPGERITREELERYLDRKEAKISYPDVLIRYATPENEEITRNEHNRFLEIHMKENNIATGVKFLKDNEKWLTQAENKYGVLKKDLVSLFEWECGLGRATGSYNAFVVLLSQLLFLDNAQKYAVDEMLKSGKGSPFADSMIKAREKKRIEKRKLYALDSFVSLLRNCKKYNVDPLTQKSSWGGALGYVQFMPNNFKYGVDADGDGNINLWTWPDAILSAANFLHQKGNYTADSLGRKRAFFKYNPSVEYAEGVITYADEIWNRYNKSLIN